MVSREWTPDVLEAHLKTLNLATVRRLYRETADQARTASYSYEVYLHELVSAEIDHRQNKRIERHVRESRIPGDKTIDAFDRERLPANVNSQVSRLLEGRFLDQNENVLAFGNPGSGKTHLLCGVAHALIQQGYRILFRPCSLLVQELLVAKRDLALPRLIKRLSRFDAILIDDIGYVQHSREEMEVLFTLLAERYETGSVLLTSNLPFSKWEQIFKDPMTTAAVIERLVHHSIILELNLNSYRLEASKGNREKKKEGKK